MDEARQQRLEKREKAQAEELIERTASDERKLKRKRALRKKQSRHRLLVIGVAVVLLVMLSVSVVNIIQLKNEEREALEKQAELKAQQEQLEKELKEADSDENIEDLAREKLKLTKPGETVYIPDSEEQ